jgi:hypothetical protein
VYVIPSQICCWPRSNKIFTCTYFSGTGCWTHKPSFKSGAHLGSELTTLESVSFLSFLGALYKINKKFWEELIAYFPLIRHGQHRKRRLQQFVVATETSLLSCYLAMILGYTDRPTDSPLIRHGPHKKWRFHQFFCFSLYSLPWERLYQAVA